MSRRIHALVLITVLVVGALISVPASAAVFKIELTNGETLETRYRPRQSTQDENKILLITKHGNWISLPKDVIESVSSDFESKGYGTVLSTTTIVLGFAAHPGRERAAGARRRRGRSCDRQAQRQLLLPVAPERW